MKNFIYLLVSLILSSLMALSCFHEDQLQKLQDYNESGDTDLPVYINVLEVTPAVNRVNVSINTNILVQFDDNIDMSTVVPSTFSINGGAVTGTFSYDDQTKTIIFVPASLAYNNIYTVALNSGIKNLVGETMESDYLWSFTTVTASQPDIEVYSPLGLPLGFLSSGGIWDFGSVSTGGSKPGVFTIKNSGDSGLIITNASLSGAHAGHFSIAVPPASPLIPSGETTMTVNFNPSSDGIKNAVLTILSDDLNDPSFIVNLTGRGLSTGEPEIQVTFSGTDVISGSTNVNFGVIPRWSSKEITFVMSNIGSDDLVISSVNITGDNPEKFSTNFSPIPFTISPNGEKTFKITFSPNWAYGMKKAEIRFNNNDSDESPFIIKVRGRGD